MASSRKQPGDQQATSRSADGQYRPNVGSVAYQDAEHSGNHHAFNEHDTRTLRALQALTDTALSHLALEALLPELLERVHAVMQVDNVAILLLDEATQELEVSAARGLEEELIGQVRIPVGVGFAGRIAATRAPLRVDDFSAYPVRNPLLREQLHSALGVPLLAGARVLGVLHVGTTTPRAFTGGEEALLEQAADRVARAVEHAQLFSSLRDASLALQRQASLINLSFEPIFAWSMESGIVEWNAGAEHLYGYTRAEALGRISHDLLRTVHSVPLKSVLAALERDGQWTGEVRHTTKNGREVFVESRQQMIDLGGQKLILETNRDVTERRQLERRTRDALDALLAMAEALVAESDTEATGEHADVSGPTAAQAQPIARRLAELTRNLLGGARVSITALDGDRLLIRPIAVAGLAPEQEAQWWEEQQATAGQPLGAGMQPQDLHRLLAGDTATFDLTRPPYELPNAYGVTMILAAPMLIEGQMIGLLALDYQDTGAGLHVFTEEEIRVTQAIARLCAVVLERERLLGEREAARAEALALAEANRRMDEFLGIAGHELRTPVTTVKANLQMAERRARQAIQAATQAAAGQPGQPGQPGKQAESKVWGALDQLLHLLERASQSAERQERLVKDLLDISRISSGRLEYRMAPYDLTALVRETVEEQRLHEPARIIELDAPDEQVPVLADADRLGQVLTNYLTNAVKYSAGDRPIVVTLRVQGPSARVEIRDQGPGLSPEQQRHLFQRFHRITGVEVVSGSAVGLGLGLYISKTIVEHHGGQVGVESAPGDGSTFWFTLPVAQSQD